MATRSSRKAVAGAESPALPVSKEAVAHVIAQIDIGLMDSYLRAIWEATTERKKALDATGDLPPQHKVEPALVKWDIDHDGAAEDMATTAVVNDPTPAVIDQPAPIIRRRRKATGKPGLGHVSARPTLNAAQMPRRMPLTKVGKANHTDVEMFHHNGLAYLKSDFKGHQVQGQTSDGSIVTFQISGVGDKSIKCLIVTEPPRNAVSGKTQLWDKWSANEPVFMPHALIAPWLIAPSNLNDYI